MIDRKVEKLKSKLRKLHWYQKIQLMDWLNSWYSDVKEQQRLEEEQCEDGEYVENVGRLIVHVHGEGHGYLHIVWRNSQYQERKFELPKTAFTTGR